PPPMSTPRLATPPALALAVLFAWVGSGLALEPLASGLKPGQRPGPYSSLVSVGQQRGQSHCFICETENRPAVIVFARGLNEPLAELVRGLDRAVADHRAAGLRAWVTFLHDDQPAFD